MSELLVTQCPHCQTRFRLTPEQLGVAGGHVRCGACLEVFHAADAAAALQPVTPAPVMDTAQPPSPAAPPPRDGLLDDDLDEPDLAALGLDESIIDEITPAGPFADLHEEFLTTPPARDFGPDFDHQRSGLSAVLSDTEGYADRGIFHRDQPDAARDANGPTDTEVETTPQPEPPRNAEQQSSHLDSEADDELVAEPEQDAPDLVSAAMEPAGLDEADPDPRREPEVTPLNLAMLEEDLLVTAGRRRRAPGWLWTVLTLAALAALPAQYLYYHFDALARHESTRPWLENLCLVARCELPARVDISRIRSANLLVRPHPEFPNALAIDVILYNRADFEQPFPVLEMQFADTGGRQVASRRFRPEEYLSGELAGVRLMPPQTPIHIGLSMLDPGTQAHSYRLEFLSP